eukprot:COSAG01_NODE_923_length_12710_cov_68.328919_3_plen_220_part_00
MGIALCLVAAAATAANIRAETPLQASSMRSSDFALGDGGRATPMCRSTFNGLCASARAASLGNCFVCAGAHQAQLVEAGCQPSDVDTLCRMPSVAPLVWPHTFAANGTENFPPHNATGLPFSFAYDLTYVDAATGIKGAQRIYRAAGTLDETCKAVRPGEACTQLAVAGQRYMIFSGYCCRCCSWEHGCGPLSATWADGATFTGTREVRQLFEKSGVGS